MSRVYVTGGKQRKGAKGEEEWFSYAEAMIMEIDLEYSTARLVASYVSPAAHVPDEPMSNIVFKAGSLDKNTMHVCTQTEILTYQLPEFTLVNCLTHKWFNDLHHVVVNAAGNFLVAVTGLDLVIEMTKEGEIVREMPVLEEDVWQRLDRDKDYRKVLTTKPHLSHPNYVFEFGGNVYATRLNQKDAICVTDRALGIAPGIEKLHDGVVANGWVYFTSVDGHIVKADLTGSREIEIFDLNAMTDTNKTLGWCRSLHLLSADQIVVGFSRIRPSKIRENVRWAKHQLGLREHAGTMGTHLACYNLATGTHEWDIDLEVHDMNAVFSILPA
ncbi:MAG: hypothetical protein ACI9UK_000318 [Candidatus Krumholzibacteriia bacterium]|jgi:hypothetical protein